MTDFSTPEAKAIFEREVQQRMDAPFFMERMQAEMLVAALMTKPMATTPAKNP